jgi:hypothetical protein
MPPLSPASADAEEVAARVARIRQLCDDLEKALGAADEQRALIAQMKRDADDVYLALTAKPSR